MMMTFQGMYIRRNVQNQLYLWIQEKILNLQPIDSENAQLLMIAYDNTGLYKTYCFYYIKDGTTCFVVQFLMGDYINSMIGY